MPDRWDKAVANFGHGLVVVVMLAAAAASALIMAGLFYGAVSILATLLGAPEEPEWLQPVTYAAAAVLWVYCLGCVDWARVRPR